ncbi:hypothetical protein D3C80_1125340 [compost metagenome]
MRDFLVKISSFRIPDKLQQLLFIHREISIDVGDIRNGSQWSHSRTRHQTSRFKSDTSDDSVDRAGNFRVPQIDIRIYQIRFCLSKFRGACLQNQICFLQFIFVYNVLLHQGLGFLNLQFCRTHCCFSTFNGSLCRANQLFVLWCRNGEKQLTFFDKLSFINQNFVYESVNFRMNVYVFDSLNGCGIICLNSC